jgi:hypothetical protein
MRQLGVAGEDFAGRAAATETGLIVDGSTLMKRQSYSACVASLLLVASAVQARAGIVFSENFDTGAAVFTTNDPYWLNQASDNGYIIKTTNNNAVAGGSFGTDITNDVTGGGYFLFEGTGFYNGAGDPNIPAGNDQFYISPNFAVAPNTDYQVSFYLTNADGIANANVQPEIAGTLLGTPVSAVGDYMSKGWQQFTFTWNSGANANASLILHDFTQGTTGNDFGIDSIRVATPEPAGFILLSVGAFGLMLHRWRRGSSRFRT